MRLGPKRGSIMVEAMEEAMAMAEAGFQSWWRRGSIMVEEADGGGGDGRGGEVMEEEVVASLEPGRRPSRRQAEARARRAAIGAPSIERGALSAVPVRDACM